MIEHWSTKLVPRQAKPIVIIGGGPSLVGYNWRPLTYAAARGRVFVVGVNDAYRLGFPEMIIFGDSHWWAMPDRGDGWGHAEALATYCRERGGDVVGCPMPTAAHLEKMRKSEYLNLIRRRPQSGLSVVPDSVAWNGNTGAAAINLALLLGATTVVLLGFDCKTNDKGEGNWHVNPNQPVPHAGLYPYFQRGFAAIANALPTYFPGVPVVNAGPDSALTVFPSANIEVYL